MRGQVLIFNFQMFRFQLRERLQFTDKIRQRNILLWIISSSSDHVSPIIIILDMAISNLTWAVRQVQ